MRRENIEEEMREFRNVMVKEEEEVRARVEDTISEIRLMMTRSTQDQLNREEEDVETEAATEGEAGLMEDQEEIEVVTWADTEVI